MRIFKTPRQGTSRTTAFRVIVPALLVWITTLAPSPSHAAQGVARHLAALEGKLVALPGQGPVLRTHQKDQPLSATTPYLFHTLLDKRLSSREVRVEGTTKADGTFEVERLYTIKDGKLYRVRYFCKTCNIEALQPGDCVCCQQPTELQEIPVPNDNAIPHS